MFCLFVLIYVYLYLLWVYQVYYWCLIISFDVILSNSDVWLLIYFPLIPHDSALDSWEFLKAFCFIAFSYFCVLFVGCCVETSRLIIVGRFVYNMEILVNVHFSIVSSGHGLWLFPGFNPPCLLGKGGALYLAQYPAFQEWVKVLLLIPGQIARQLIKSKSYVTLTKIIKSVSTVVPNKTEYWQILRTCNMHCQL